MKRNKFMNNNSEKTIETISQDFTTSSSLETLNDQANRIKEKKSRVEKSRGCRVIEKLVTCHCNHADRNDQVISTINNCISTIKHVPRYVDRDFAI